MDLIFICPQTNDLFKSGKFEIIDNRGVKTDANGNKTLDAKVRLTEPCPFCGGQHLYHAAELSCPFSRPETEKEHNRGRV